jgi:hypothetical protein
MTREELFDAWAPAGGPWSDWAKPVLFAHWPRPLPEAARDGPAVDLSWVPGSDQHVVLVLDLPGVECARLGLALAAVGYRPVPLFNAVPPPASEPAAAGLAVVPVEPMLAELAHGAEQLRASPPPADAPPAFLLDTDRQTATRDLSPGAFDNRSVVFATDFPSAARLATHGIRRALLVRKQPGSVGDDLADALRAWQTDGLSIDVVLLSQLGPPIPLLLPRLRWWTRLWQWLTAGTRFRRNETGSFGAFIPHPSGG